MAKERSRRSCGNLIADCPAKASTGLPHGIFHLEHLSRTRPYHASCARGSDPARGQAS
jgi:hypothetical protein